MVVGRLFVVVSWNMYVEVEVAFEAAETSSRWPGSWAMGEADAVAEELDSELVQVHVDSKRLARSWLLHPGFDAVGVAYVSGHLSRARPGQH